MNAELAVLKRMLFGRSSERARPSPADGGGDGGDEGRPAGGGKSGKRGPGARAGRRDYSHLPRVEVVWDFPDGGYCCPECGTPFHRLGDHVTEVLDWVVIVRVSRALPPPVPAGVHVPGPGHGDRAGPAEGDRQGPGLQRVHRAPAHRAVCGRALPELAGHRPGPARRGPLPGHADRDLRRRGGAAGPAGRRDHRAVAGLVAPARRRDQLAGVHPTREQRPRQRPGQRPGEVVAVGLPRPGHRLLRHGPHPLGRGAGPPRRDRPDHRPTRRTPRRRRGGGAAAAGHLQRLLQRLHLGRPQGLPGW